jgi:hypothetical protein
MLVGIMKARADKRVAKVKGLCAVGSCWGLAGRADSEDAPIANDNGSACCWHAPFDKHMVSTDDMRL